ncbi:MAG: hypothetical protein QOH43_1904 [Solirubrobacteraceae bacterium]|nr:hypothetical protein [Solirubrobacteraceae bacterium]
MPRPRLLALVAAVVLIPAATAQAGFLRFGPAREIAPATTTAFAFGLDAAGGGIVVRGAGTAARQTALEVLTRPPGGTAWTSSTLPETTGASVGPVLAAARSAAADGQGAAVIAWRVDRPRHYSGIQVTIRDPGEGGFGRPVTLADPQANGVRHPAVAISSAGDTVVAWDTGTRATHLNVQGRIAVAVRPRGGGFGPPRIVTTSVAGAPAVGIGDDGRAVVAWERGHRVEAVGIGADGHLGTVKAVGKLRSAQTNPSVAVAPSGRAVVAWADRSSRREGLVYAAARAPRGVFGHAQRLRTVPQTRTVNGVVATAGRAGHLAVAWAEDDYTGHPRDRGYNGVYARAWATTAPAAGGPFRAAFPLSPGRAGYTGAPSVAMAGDGTLLAAWSFRDTDADSGIEAVTASGGRATAPQRLSSPLGPSYLVFGPGPEVGVAGRGATVVLPAPGTPTGTPVALLAADAGP